MNLPPQWCRFVHLFLPLGICIAWVLAGWTSAAQTLKPGYRSAGEESELSLPQAPEPRSPYPGTPKPISNESYFLRMGALCGAGASTSSARTIPSAGCGAGLTLVPLPVFFEIGVMGPQANRSYLTGYISLDGSIPLAPLSSRYFPTAILGYSRFFETGHALDYGVALTVPRDSRDKGIDRSLRVELRDYWTFANPSQHNVMLRVGWMLEEAD